MTRSTRAQRSGRIRKLKPAWTAGSRAAAKIPVEIPVFAEWHRREFDKSSWPMRVFDHETFRYLAVNDAAVKFYGHTRQEFLALTAKDTRHPEEHNLLLTYMREPTGYLRYRGPRRHIKKSGETVVVESVTQDIVFKGRLARLAMTIDVSDKIRMQELLWLRLQEFETLAENLPALIARFDGERRYVYANSAVERLLNRARHEIIGKTPGDLMIGNTLAAQFERSMDEAFRNGESHTLEFSMTTSGGERFFEAQHVPERDAAGQIATVLCVAHDITERKKSESELRQQKNLLEAIVDNLPVGVFTRDAETLRYMIRNRFCENMSGCAVDTSVGKTAYDLFPRELADRITATDREALETGQMQEVPEQEMMGRSGESRIFHVRKLPLTSEDGKPWMLLGIMEDVTVRKRAEIALRESNEFLRSVIESSRDCIKVLDLDGRLQMMNAGGQRLLEIDDLEPLLNTSWVDLWKDTDVRAARAAVATARNGRTGRFEGYCPTMKGTPKWWGVVVNPILGSDGRPAKLLATSRDITEHKQVRDLHDRLAAVVNDSMDAIVSKDPDGIIATWNAGAERLFGYRAAEAIGRPITMVIPDVCRDEEERILARIRRGERVEQFESIRRRKDGTLVDVSLTVSPIKDAAGRIVGAAKIARDITERKQNEAALQRSAELSRLLESLARATNESGTPNAAMAACLALVCAHGQWTIGRVNLFENGAPEITPGRSIWYAPGRERFAKFILRSDGQPLRPGPFLGRVARERMPVWIEDVQNGPDFGRRELLIEHGLHSAFAFPIIARGEVVAIMELFAEKPRSRDALTMGAAQSLASQLARLIEREWGHQANARMAAIVESSQDAIASRKLDGTVTSWNPAAERLFGYTAAEMVGRNVLEIVVPAEFREDVRDRQALVRSGQTAAPHETVRVGKDGRRIHVSVSPAPIRDSNGEIVGISLNFRDITLRKLSEQALRESEERFRQLTENIRQVFWIAMPDLSKLIYVSPAYEEIWGRSRESLYRDARSWMIPIHPEDQPRVVQAAERMARGEQLDVEYRVIRPDGTLRWIRDRSYRMTGENGTLLACGLAEDTTDIKAAEQELRQTQQHLQVAVHGGGVGLWDWDVKADTVYFSPEWKQQLGYEDREIPNRFSEWNSRLHPEDQERVSTQVKDYLNRPDQYYKAEYRLRHRDGSYRWILSQAAAQLGKDGSVERMFGCHVDITEQKQAETERFESAVRQRDALVREVHHRIKNSLQGVAGLLRQKVRKYPAVAPGIDEAIAQLQSVALIYGLQETRADGLLSLAEITDAICSSAESLIGGRVERVFERKSPRPACLAGPEAVSVAVALNELVFNALKHQRAQAGKKRARVALCETQGTAELRISNRGRLPKGFDFAAGQIAGSGLGLVRTLLASSGGNIKFNGGRNEVEVIVTLSPPLLAERGKTNTRRKPDGDAKQERAATTHTGGGRRPVGAGRPG